MSHEDDKSDIVPLYDLLPDGRIQPLSPDGTPNGEPIKRKKTSQPDIDICRECGEHAEFDEDTGESNCCGSKPYDTDYETEYDK